jgi:hypothetical protein
VRQPWDRNGTGDGQYNRAMPKSPRSPEDGDLWFVQAQFDVPAGRLAGTGWAVVVARSRREARLMAQTAMREEWQRRTGDWVAFERDTFSYSRVEQISATTVRPIASHVEPFVPPTPLPAERPPDTA